MSMDYFRPDHPRHKKAVRCWCCVCMMNGNVPKLAKRYYLKVLEGKYQEI